MKGLLEVKNIDFLDGLFAKFKPQLSKIQFVGTISVFSFCFKSEIELNDNWEIITSSIAANYQSEFEEEETEFERWNIYILFLVKGCVSNQLKYKIENDKFSSRKIIQDGINEELNSNSVSDLILKHIINSDLDISIIDNKDTTGKISTYSNDSKIYQLIEASSESETFMKKADKKAEKNKFEILYQKIIKEVKNEIQKS
jgi:hypothetical protein